MKKAALALVTLAVVAHLGAACGSDSGDKKNLDPTADGGAGTGGFGGGGAEGGIDLDGTAPNPCEAPDAPEDCKLVPSGPACGDAEINQDSEECDDGNSLPGDGCSGVCAVESYHECPTPGEPCVSTIECGDGVIGPGEACDDGNTTGGDGCSATCNLVEKGYLCPKPDQDCIRVHLCGDDTVDSNEGCDDGNPDAGDGCDAKCRVELGWKCDGSPSTCTATTCGDGTTEGAESCDDSNTIPFDGCSAVCQAEPDCNGSSCTSSCGDGIVLGEDCDDGNLRDGDGCSSSCAVEDGYDCVGAGACTMIGGKCALKVPVVFRDFNASHSDFEPGANSTGQAGLVLPTLDAEGKPVYSGAANGGIASVASFADWYRDAPPTNATIVDTMTLWENGSGGFVNRWGPNGEPWQAYANLVWCGNGGTNCASCAAGSYDVCLDPCTPWGNTSECGGTAVDDDGDPVFFPLDGNPNALGDTRFTAKIAPEYGGNWDAEPGSPLHNFHFTTEVHYWFQYDAAAPVQLDFTGDDDVWVFVNKKLALDLGGWHPPQSGSVTINATTAAGYGLASGKVYQIAVFHAERKTDGSSFRLTLSGFDLAPSDCATDCGDGTLAPGEECDDGASSNTGGYGACSPDCTLGPRCGDGIEQDQEGEACDDGTNDGAYGGCAPDCQPGPHCGDGVVQPDHEQCDDKKNDGGYGECAPGCVLGAHCGDGHLNVPYEDCDDGNDDDEDGCSGACKKEVAVPR